jgi:NAD(P)-dependent dehydrogenase (short-subunit alcohol dehydrogenase family)
MSEIGATSSSRRRRKARFKETHMQSLLGKSAIITGASSGIGRAAACQFAAEGAKVVLVARRAQMLDDAVREIEDAGGEAIAVAGDVCEEATHARSVEAAVARFGGLDIAFNNAGALGERGAAADISVEGWRNALDANLTSAFLAAKNQLPAIEKRGGGSVIFTSTFVGHITGFPGMAPYAAAKAGLIGLIRVLAVEYAERSVRVNALLPGGVDTPMGWEAAGSQEMQRFIASLHPVRRLAAPEEIARAALFLASDAASFVTGSTLVADGGVSMSKA